MTALTDVTLLDRYRLETELGRGGMGTVYRAYDIVLKRDVAIKLLSATGLGTEGKARMLREAQSVAALNHPNIVAVYDAGEADLGSSSGTASGATHFVVMELVVGQNLSEAPPRDLDQVVDISRQLCAALDHAHSNQIIHRDLKPENVLLSEQGTAKLVDFGLARSVTSRLTVEGTITGTLAYLPPELALGQDFDGRADLYSLGVMLYELTTGQLPFTADDPVSIITQHLYAPVVPPRAHNPEIPPSLDALIVKLMAKEADNRPASAAIVLSALERLELDDEAAPAGELSLLDRIVRGRLIGRENELREARALWNRAALGEGQTLFISGEPGIGKTRLTREMVTQVDVTGGKALVGECYAEGGPPYAPFAQIVRRALQNGGRQGTPGVISSDSERAVELPSFVLADLLTLAPELRLTYGSVPSNPTLDPESEQQRLIESLVVMCKVLSERHPLLIVLEDAHWAESGTLAILRHLSRRVRRLPVMLIATYREVELDETLPFNQVLMDLNRERLAVRIKLSRFNRQETAAMLAALFAEEVTPGFLEGIYRETEGNPFFIEEVCKSLVESGQLYHEDGAWHRPQQMADMAIPQSVRVAIQSRVSKFPDEYQETFNLAAILGREFDYDTLVEASDLDEDTLIDALEAAEGAQLIEEVSGVGGATFSFVHALIPTTLAEGVRTLRRKRLHHRAAQAIESLRPEAFEDLAHHYYESGDVDGGLEYSLKAGERALELSAHIEARHHYNQALEIAEAGGRSDELLSIHLALGDIEGVADFNRALISYNQALVLTQDPIQQAIIKVKIGRLHAVTGNELGLSLLQEAVNTLNPETHGNELAQAIASIARFYHNRGQHRQAMEQLERAREIADPLQDVPTLIYVYTFLAGSYQHLANFQRSNEWARREIEMGSEANYPFMEAVGYEYLAENHTFMGRWEEALEYGQRDQELGENNGLLERVRWAQLIRLWALHNMGQVELGIEEGLLSLDQAEANGDMRLAVLAGAELARAYGNTNDFDTARQLADIAIGRALDLDQAYMICVAYDALAYLHGLHGEWQQALEHREATVEAAEGSDNRLIPMTNSPGLAEALLEAGRADEAAKRLDEGLEIARESSSPFPEARALRVLGRIHAHREKVESASNAFADAVKICEEEGSQLLAGRILLDWASLQVAHESKQTAVSTFERSLEIFETAGAKYWVDRTVAALEEVVGDGSHR